MGLCLNVEMSIVTSPTSYQAQAQNLSIEFAPCRRRWPQSRRRHRDGAEVELLQVADEAALHAVREGHDGGKGSVAFFGEDGSVDTAQLELGNATFTSKARATMTQ